MFTGLIQAVGQVSSRASSEAGARLLISPGDWPHQPRPGDSIAVNGCCLTHAPQNAEGPRVLAFDVVPQTLARTTLGELRPGDVVNLESCLTPSSPIGGHFVQGHIDGVADVQDLATCDGYRLTIRTEASLIRYIVPTGSIAVDGVSLTVAGVDPGACTFAVALIPTTLQHTTLGRRRAGDRVNIEVDVLVKAAVHYLENFSAHQ
jgi:riboflavin synthase alpha subunit